jgi:DNA-directed RNA polymerase subunit RPC12/RpoP
MKRCPKCGHVLVDEDRVHNCDGTPHMVCLRCGRPAGDDYHIAGAGGVTCDECWDERLR